MSPEDLKRGRIAYMAHCEFAEEPAPAFESLNEEMQRRWAFAAHVIAIHTSGQLAERVLSARERRFDSFARATR